MIKSTWNWLQEPDYVHYNVLDPDGKDWNQLISEEDFQERLMQSTVQILN